MKEIKFRAYDLKKKVVFPVHRIDFNKINQSIEFIKGYDDWDKDGYTVYGGGNMKYANKDRYILMQYTGLKDKNGKEIYEGDIVKVFLSCKGDYITAEIKYSEEYAQYIIVNTRCIIHEAESLGDYNELEIIGNIYDNPDLLEKGKEE